MSEEEKEHPRETRHRTPTSPVSSSKEERARRQRSTSSEGRIKRLIAKSKEATEERAEGEEKREEASDSEEKGDVRRRDISRSRLRRHPGGFIEDLLIQPREEYRGEDRWGKNKGKKKREQQRRLKEHASKAKAAAKGRAKALARLPVALPRVRRRPAGEEEREDPAVLRRPAGRELWTGERFERGEIVNVVELLRHLVRPGQSLIVVEGNYWEAPVTLCGTVEKVEEDGAGVVVEVRLSGTENEDLLKWSTALQVAHVRRRLRGRSMRGRVGPREESQASPPRSRGGVAGQPGGPCAVSSGRHGGLEREGQRAGQGGFESRGKEEAEKRVEFFNQIIQPEEKEEEKKEEEGKEGGKGRSNEGAERRVRKHRDGPGRQSKETGGEKGEEKPEAVAEADGLLGRVGVRGPGVLAAASINEMKKPLVAASGQLWGQSRDLAPVGVHYFRTVLQLKLHGAMAREAFTLTYGADLLAQGRVAEASCALWKQLR